MANLAQSVLQSDGANTPESKATHRRRSIRVLFVHRDAGVIDDCLQELKRAQFVVTADVVLTLGQCKEQLRSHSYDVVVAEFPSPTWKEPQAVQFLAEEQTPLIFVTAGARRDSLAELTAHGAFDYVQREHVAQLPMAARRAVNERKLREELEEARSALQHSQSLYRALMDNPAYGIYRCNAEGKIVDVNQALVAMLGYTSKEELLAENHSAESLALLGAALPAAGRSRETLQIEPVETEWKRKDGTTLKAKISGRGRYDERGSFAGYEIIAVDVTEQRRLEEQLRHQASSDSLTGLANHRRLFEVLHAEISRSKRTGREFCVVLLDLDGLKQVNDRFSHIAGDRALCRLGQILKDCCRSIDTAARHGGDEFALVLPETGLAAATMVAHRICELLERDAEKPALSVSVGIASYPGEADSIGSLLYAADQALYAMKGRRPTIAARAGRGS
jgi:diguanylate cyclase (GGDEF)-like protein/PAS domain S-box-containing protein